MNVSIYYPSFEATAGGRSFVAQRVFEDLLQRVERSKSGKRMLIIDRAERINSYDADGFRNAWEAHGGIV